MKQCFKSFILTLLFILPLVYTSSEVKAQADPAAGLVLTFDDHSVSDWLAAQPLFDQYGAKATYYINLIGQLPRKDTQGLYTLREAGHEIGSHGYIHTSATEYLKEHTMAEYLHDEIIPSVQRMEELGIRPTSFAYPYGTRNKELDQELLNYFSILRGTAYLEPNQPIAKLEQIFYTLDQEPKVIYGIGLDEHYGYSDEEILQALQHAVDTNRIVVFYGHRMDETNQLVGDYTHWSRLEKIFQFAKAHQMTYYTASELSFE